MAVSVSTGIRLSIHGEEMAPSHSIVAGVLIGGAIGDAMGAPFEGLWAKDIPSRKSLLRSFHLYHGYPTGQYTDDTQLTLATVRSIVKERDIVVHDIARSIAELWRHHSVIGPGGACTRAAEHFLATGKHQEMGAPIGQAGNGTAMRTAALGLWFGSDQQNLTSTVAAISRLTHQDPRSVAGGVVVALAANLLASDSSISDIDLCNALANPVKQINLELSELILALPVKMKSSDPERFIAAAGQATAEFSSPIITPFVIPTVLAALFCVMRHRDSWSDAVTTAVRFGGDVDTLGSIVGALAGAIHGLDGIPINLQRELQDSQAIQITATRYHQLLTSRLLDSSNSQG